ncbi:hypothetical protein [Leifsonia xyli]|uniref:hypothetical protein n=1 Tax=Leifsonia xyli TaxID=1575 RepID=UPI003D677531
MDADDKKTPAGEPEYPDYAGYPDGQGTLDEGTGAYRDGDGSENGTGGGAVGPTGDEAADDGGRDDTGAEGEAVAESLTDPDATDSRGV